MLEGEKVFERGIGSLRFLNPRAVVEEVGRVDLEDLSDSIEVVDRDSDFTAFEFAIVAGTHAEFFCHVFLTEACKGALLSNAFTNDFVHESKVV